MSFVLFSLSWADDFVSQALLHYYDKKTGKKSRRPPQFAKKGQKIIALIEVAAPISVERCALLPFAWRIEN